MTDALAVAREVQKQRPKESMGYILEGDIHASKKAWGEAVAAYRNGLKQAGTTDLAIRLDATLRAGGSVAGRRQIRRDLAEGSSQGSRPSATILRKAAMAQEGLRDCARRSTGPRSTIEPNDALALNNLAWVAGQIEGSRRRSSMRNRPTSSRPNNAAILDTFGMLLVEKGETKRGVEMLQKAVSLAPSVAGFASISLAR